MAVSTGAWPTGERRWSEGAWHRSMRLWTVHPKYLDSSGLTAAWREGLLARKVLQGQTRGYRSHPQLMRFRAHAHPTICIEQYLVGLFDEATARGYRFDAHKIADGMTRRRITETEGQLRYEWAHLKRKLRQRAPALYQRFRAIAMPEAHPLFRIVPGDVRAWERVGRTRRPRR